MNYSLPVKIIIPAREMLDYCPYLEMDCMKCLAIECIQDQSEGSAPAWMDIILEKTIIKE